MIKPFIFILFFIFSNAVLAQVNLVKVDKSQNKMYLFKGDTVVKTYRIALGESPKGHKEKQGDNKTPEGLYTLDFIKEDSDFHRAIHISYPNEQDIKNAEQKGISPGGQIMIHGESQMKDEFSRFRRMINWTNGCIALTNRDMDEFLSLVSVGTQIHIEW